MANSRSEVWVGATIVIAVIGCVAMMFKVGNLQSFLRSEKHYTIVFENVHGLQEGDPVRYAGVNVGKVTAVEVQYGTDEAPAKALIRVEVDASYRITDQSEARIKESLTGITSVDIRPQPGQTLEDGAEIKSKDVAALGDITERASQLLSEEQLKRIESIIENTDETIKSFKEIVNNINQRLTQEDGDINGIIHDLKVTTSEIRGFVEQNTKEFDRIVSDAASVVSGIEKFVADNEAKISSIIENINTTSEVLPDVAERVKQTLAEVHVLTDKAVRMLDSGNEILDDNKGDVRAVVRNLKDTSDYLVALGQDLNRRPWRLLNPPKSEDAESENLYLLAKELSNTVGQLNEIGQSIQKLAAALETQDSQDKQTFLALIAKFGEVLDDLQRSIKTQSETFKKISFDKK